MRNDKKRWVLCLAAVMSFSLAMGMTFSASEDVPEEVAEEIAEDTASGDTTAEDTAAEDASGEDAASEDIREAGEEDPHAVMDGNRNYAIDLSEMTEETWGRLAMIDDDKVETGVNIRESADGDGRVVACLYPGGVVEIVDKGSEWSEIKSGAVWGYVRNEYLMFGSDIKGLVDYYGIDGVKASWDDVHVFEEADGSARTVYWAIADEIFPVVEDQGHWLSIRLKTKKMSEEQLADAGYDPETVAEEVLAFVSIEDVKKVILLDTAVALEDAEREDESEGEEEESYEEDSYDDSYNDDASRTDNDSYSDNYTAPTYTDNNSSGTEVPRTPNTETPSTEAPSTEAPSTEAPRTDTPDASGGDDDYGDDGSDQDVGDDTYYDDYTGGDGYDDEYEEIEEIEDAEEYADYSVEADYSDDTYSSEGDTYGYDAAVYRYSEDYAEEYTEDYVDDVDTSDEYYEEVTDYGDDDSSEASSSYGASDTDLLAAIIYCEAGNQSYDGMVAVGAVVMNRVASASFPGSVSDVVYQSGQFTPASSGALSSALANGVPGACYDAAAAAMSGEDPTGGALYFNAGSDSGTRIGDHQFV